MNHLFQTLESFLPSKKLIFNPSDSLLMSSVPYYILPALIVLAVFFIETYSFIIIAIIYSVLPLLDEVISMDWRNPNKQERQLLEENDIQFKTVIYLTGVVDWILFFKMMNVFAQYEFTPFSILNLLGIFIIFGTFQAAQFTIAHELFHKQNYLHRFFGTIHMLKALYIHFTYEHLWGHHRKVATPEDPASAEKGITMYKFIVRSFIGSYKSVYKM